MITFCKYLLVFNLLILASLGVLYFGNLDISGGNPLDYYAFFAAWYTILVTPVSSLVATIYLSHKKVWQTIPGGNIQVGGNHLKIAISILLLLAVGGIHYSTMQIKKEGLAKAKERDALMKALEDKTAALEKRKNSGEEISQEEYNAIDCEKNRIFRFYPPYYHTENRINALYAIEFILSIFAVGLLLAKSTMES